MSIVIALILALGTTNSPSSSLTTPKKESSFPPLNPKPEQTLVCTQYVDALGIPVLRSDKTIDFRIFPERVRPGDDICLVLDRDAAVKVSFQGRIWYEKDRPARYIPLTLPAKTRGIGVKIEVECLDQPCKGERVIQWSE